MIVTAEVNCPVYDSFNVQQVSGIFDVPPAQKLNQTFTVDIPSQDEAWSIGAIIGPSGSGKTTIARKYLGRELYEMGDWPANKAIVDCFGDKSVKEVSRF